VSSPPPVEGYQVSTSDAASRSAALSRLIGGRGPWPLPITPTKAVTCRQHFSGGRLCFSASPGRPSRPRLSRRYGDQPCMSGLFREARSR
jgi:hypothetical protein